MSKLDKLAVAMIILGAAFVTWAVDAPFFRWTMAGSVFLLLRSRMAGKPTLGSLAVLLPCFVLLRPPVMGVITWLTPHPMDAALLGTDFGVSDKLFVWAQSNDVIWQVTKFVYLAGLPVWTAIVVGFADKPKNLVGRMVLASIAALPCYVLCPAVGPVWVHGDGAMRNCVPSLHFAWALLLWWYSPKSLRAPSALFAALTGLATLAVGEHYVIDLLAAVPFTAAICWASDFSGSRVPRFPLKYLFDTRCGCPGGAA